LLDENSSGIPGSGGVDFLANSGEMGILISKKNWEGSPVGFPETWPQSLKIAVRIMLSSRYAMWMAWGPDLTFFCNDAYKPTLGIKGNWALGEPSSKVWEEIWPDIGPRIQKVFDAGTATWDEDLLLFLERSGYPEETYHTFSYSPLPDDNGQVAGMLCVVTEETERVIGQRRLTSLRELAADLSATKREDEVIRAIAHRLSLNRRDLPFILLYLFDEGDDTARLVCSSGISKDHPAAAPVIRLNCETMPWPADQLLSRSTPLTIPQLQARFEQLPAGDWAKPPRDAIMIPIASQGQARPAGFLVAALNPYRPLDDAYTGFLDLVAGQISSSIAKARAYEEERKRAEALAEIDRAKTQFFSNVSHEFRTPLTLMLGPIEEMLEADAGAPASEAQRQRVAALHRNSLRLLKLVNTLLDFSRIEAGRVQARYRPTDLAVYTAELASSFRAAIQKAGLVLTVKCPPLSQPVYADHDMWEKIVLNLLSNAFKFTFDGEITVEVGTADGGAAAQLIVSDTGTGIPKEELPRLFERFHRVKSAKGRTFEGSGIGLALVQELVRLHGGSIRVESELGSGSAFIVTLPLGDAHLPPDRVDGVPLEAVTGVRTEAYVQEALRWLPESQNAEPITAPAADDLADDLSGRQSFGEHILIADDNADMRDYVRRLLASKAYSVTVAADGEAALTAARERKPHLILSDVMMPKLDGFQLVAAVRADPALRDTPVVLLSARAGEEARVEGLDAGADDYLTKPFSARELLARVASNIKLARLRDETEQALREEAAALETLNRVGAAVAAELNLNRAVQIVTDAATKISGAEFGAFFYNILDERGESYMLYALSGVPLEAFSKFPMPRNTALFAPTFAGEGIVRSGDILQDPRYGKNDPHYGMPKGHLPVRSYLAVPVISRSGEPVGGLFFGHSKPGIFDERAERLVAGIASQAAIAIDNARLFEAAQLEIKKRSAIENELRSLNETLEMRVSDRTAELARANEVLRQREKMDIVGQLTGGIAHDFNNLLTIIIGNLQTLQRQLGDPGTDISRLKRSAENASRGANRAASLTQRLLAFARRQPLDPRPVDVNKLVLGMSELLRRTLGEQITVAPVLSGGLWRSNVDPNQLETAILNLAVNARDAMPNGGRLTIETANAHLDEGYAARQAEVLPGQYAVIAVTDTGIGMTKEVMAKVFEPFFTTKDIGHGTGLGLSQVYGFVKQTGGHAKIYSEPGAGTTVKLYLPRLFGEDDAGEAEPETETVPIGNRAETILVVEDDEDVRAYSTGIMTEAGYRVLEASSGESALDILERHSGIALLFTDVGLPGGMNGRQLADEARRRHPKLKVLFTTGYARNAIVHDGRLDPGVQLLTKPFTFAALATKVRELLDLNSQKACILLVEDEALVSIVTAETLETFGYRVEMAASATEAISKFRAVGGHVDAAVVDLGLPDRKGDALAIELRAMRKDLPIIIATGYGADSIRERFKGDPLIAFLGKPFAADQLGAALSGLGLEPAT
jgi:signal transduction histidine kinase/DNA-binding response OmpR family regulator